MRIFVLGSSGMLGNYVSKYFKSQEFGVVDITRDSLNAVNATKDDLERLRPEAGDVFINCIGVIKQRGTTPDDVFIRVNSAFPRMVADYCEENEIKFIHVTTDCVFDGNQGHYYEHSEHNETDIYGKSKSFGEPTNATVIRTSIIGEEKDNKKSLLEWVKSSAGTTVNGFTNHHWNGITCLQFAKVCEYVINNDLYWEGVRHINSPDSFNKAELVQMISNVFDLNVTVTPIITVTEAKCDRTLYSIKKPLGLEIPSLKEQLVELKDFGV